jgi:branched-subunit amino acid transport protein
MSWSAVLVLCAAAYALKALGLVLAGHLPAAVRDGALDLLVVPVLAALIVVQTLDGGRELVLDARVPAVLVAAILVWRRAPVLVIVLAAGATAALLRLAA